MKLKTGISTNEDFIKVMKDLGQEVVPGIPAETLRTKLDLVNEEVDVTFQSTNETILQAVNEGTGPTPVETIELKSASGIDASGALPSDNPGIAANADKYTVSKSGDTITITDNGIEAYIGRNIDEPRKWVGFLVDLNVKAQGTGYTIEDIDYSDAARWGAENDTTFLMWLTVEGGDREIVFKNVADETDTITVTIEFAE